MEISYGTRPLKLPQKVRKNTDGLHYTCFFKKNNKKNVESLKKDAKDAKKVYLATDPDREGEAIAWHSIFVDTRVAYCLLVFENCVEITEK